LPVGQRLGSVERKRYPSISLRVRGDLLCFLKLIWVVQSSLQKYFTSPVGQIISTSSRHPTPQEGRIAIVTDAGCGCGGRGSVLRATGLQGGSMRPVSDHQASGREMLQRTAKSCGPDAPTLVSSLRSLSRPYRAWTKLNPQATVEERSDEAIHSFLAALWIASLRSQ
jgi:hypothetical protein